MDGLRTRTVRTMGTLQLIANRRLRYPGQINYHAGRVPRVVASDVVRWTLGRLDGCAFWGALLVASVLKRIGTPVRRFFTHRMTQRAQNADTAKSKHERRVRSLILVEAEVIPRENELSMLSADFRLR